MTQEKAENCTGMRLTGQPKSTVAPDKNECERFGQEHKQHVGTKDKWKGDIPQCLSRWKPISCVLLQCFMQEDAFSCCSTSRQTSRRNVGHSSSTVQRPQEHFQNLSMGAGALRNANPSVRSWHEHSKRVKDRPFKRSREEKVFREARDRILFLLKFIIRGVLREEDCIVSHGLYEAGEQEEKRKLSSGHSDSS